ncbi:uncharacterized protein PODANS_1_12170 [Podospora anserina S mat+]|uniref:Podospora anserina S mat+ genomic DNA chromosome 1, supercontig 2 n=1 Tax=Podospora anserina (strain S / ATCC MYA-4624 / DSM 980 / FGSC 10383) TaxID=515849 RepID=B2AYT5_PODAN|nr:uncharacterized protein PODANS_1_12170 [Podospora anserina S mat+]CAP69559.1 unnamed protein product [Podospora anserina S mat+]CDP23576.1 Putative protein of unknown function [Podospora anserina S mat+]
MPSSATVTLFQTLDVESLDSGNQLPGDAVAKVKSQPDFQQGFFGQKLEDPKTWVLATEWSSASAAKQCITRIKDHVRAQETFVYQFDTAVLKAPCTEVFTAFETEEGFEEQVARFVSAVEGDKLEGYKGADYGAEVKVDGDGAGEKSVRMVIGWVSKEAHVEAKGKPGAIQENIGELRAKRKGVDLFHVNFKEL